MSASVHLAATIVRPMVSVVLATCERPGFLPLALGGYRHQTYQPRELIVVDDGARFPVSERVVVEAGGRLIRLPPGTELGTKLNAGLEAGRGPLALKMDDDDWYAPTFLAALVDRLLAESHGSGRMVIAGVGPYLFFDLARWELRQADMVSGATLLFAREDWRRAPFRPVPLNEDTWFLNDQAAIGVGLIKVAALEAYLAVRHGSHRWATAGGDRPFSDLLQGLPLHHRRPEMLLPGWALDRYRGLHRELTGATSAGVCYTT